MDNKVLEKVKKIAFNIRSLMEKKYGTDTDLCGHCIEASETIAKEIKKIGVKAITVEGWCRYDDEYYGSDCPWDPHTWVEIPEWGIYIDVTADQFNFGMYPENDFPNVIVQKGLPHGMSYEEPAWQENLECFHVSHLKNGYYIELDEIKKDVPDADFGFLENETCSDADTEFNAFSFLHGYCDSFAFALSEKYGYSIETLIGEYNSLIHAYCVSEIAGEKAYIDIRGITTDAKLFFEEFEDFVDYEDGTFYTTTSEATLRTYKDKDLFIQDGFGKLGGIPEAKDFLRWQDQYYNTERVGTKENLSLIEQIYRAEREVKNPHVKNNTNNEHKIEPFLKGERL